MEEEIWKDIKGFEGKYKVSNWGRVKSLVDNHGKFREKILSLSKNTWGYLQVGLSKAGTRKGYTIHRLVLSTFNPIDGIENLEINHIDEDKTNNRLENLEWCDRSYNNNYGTRNDRISEKLTNGKKSTPIVQLSIEGKYIRSYKNASDAERECGFNRCNINKCCNNKYSSEGNNIYKGYRWMYLSEYMDKYCGIID